MRQVFRCPARGRRGVTLLEIMLAVGIVAVAILALQAVFLNGLRQMAEAARITAATDVGRSFMESVKKAGYSTTAVGTFDGSVPDTPDAATGFPPPPYPKAPLNGQEFYLVVSCADYAPGLRSVRVDVHWTKQRKIRLMTLVRQ